MLPRVSSADALLATGHAPRDGCVTAAGHSQGTVRQSLFVRNRSFGSVQCHRATRKAFTRTAMLPSSHRSPNLIAVHEIGNGFTSLAVKPGVVHQLLPGDRVGTRADAQEPPERHHHVYHAPAHLLDDQMRMVPMGVPCGS